MSFVKALINYTAETESPTSFWRWSAYAAIAAVLRDNVFWYNKTRKTCCNLFIILLADSGAQRKGTPIDLTYTLLSKVKTIKLIRGRMSVQGLLEDLSNTENVNGVQRHGGSCLVCSDEISASFIEDSALLKLLTDIYDYRPEFPYRLRGGIAFSIKNLCVNILAASNERLLREVYSDSAIYGGLMARTFFVTPDTSRKGNSLWGDMEKSQEEIDKEINPLVEQLKNIAALRGSVHFTDEAKQAFDSWYIPFREGYLKKPDQTGVLARLHTGVLKLATILAIDQTFEKVVNKIQIEESIGECSELVKAYEIYAMQSKSSSRNDKAQCATWLLAEAYQNRGEIKRRSFISKHLAEISSDILDIAVTSLTEAGLIAATYNLVNGDTTYRMTDKAKEIFERKLK